MNYSLILLLAGKGKRTNLEYNKALYKVNDKELFKYSLDFFIKDNRLNEIILVVNKDDISIINELIKDYKSNIKVVLGGETRSESTYNGLNHVSNEIVLIHDSARPILYKEDIDRLLNEVEMNKNGATLVNKISNSLIKEENNNISYVNRDYVYSIITPQCFNKDKLLYSYNLHKSKSYKDDSEIYNKEFSDTKIIISDNISLKVTNKIDLIIIKELLENENR